VLDDNFDPVPVKSNPRVSPEFVTEEMEIVEPTKRVWSFKDSFFKDFQQDNDAINGECFDFDWCYINIPRIEEESLEQIRLLIKKNYKMMKDMYRYCAGLGREKNFY
jgi:hypothetical protein